MKSSIIDNFNIIDYTTDKLSIISDKIVDIIASLPVVL